MKQVSKNPSQTIYNILNRSIFLIILLIFSFTAKAINPGKIEGSVTDADTYKPIPYARVDLLKNPDSTIVKSVQTDLEGKYIFEDIAFGIYFIKVSGMTYRNQWIPDIEITPVKPNVKFGATNLLPDSKTLGEVNVTAYKLTGEMQDDKTIYTIKGKAADIAQSGLELLRQLPDVSVGYMSNDVKLAGSTNILFQVNGKKVDANFLMQLNPKLVDKIEVITNPGVKYDSDVDAVINILLKKDMPYGLSGRLRLEIPTAKTFFTNSNNGGIDVFYKKVRVFVSGYGGMQRWDMGSVVTRSSFPESGNPSGLTQLASGTTSNKYGGFNYGADWFIDDKNTFNFYSSLRPRIPNKNTLISDNTYIADQTSTNRGTNISDNQNLFYDYSFFYKHKFSKKDHELSLESYLSNRNGINKTEFYEQAYLGDGDLSDQFLNWKNQTSETNNKQLSLKADYTYPFSEKLKLSGGYNGNFSKSDNSYTEKIQGSFYRTDYDENRNVGYMNLSWNVGNLNLQAGMRYELSDIHIINGSDSTYQYNYFLPSLSGQYKLGKKHSFRLNYRRYPQRPGVNQLNPVSYSDDAYSQTIGNPKLKPAFNDRIEFTHRIQLKGPMYVSYRPYISFVNKGIRQITLPSTDSVLRKQYSNISNEFEYGVTLSGTFAFVKWWSVSPTYTYYNRKLDALPQYGITEAQNRKSWRLGVSSSFTLPKDMVIFIEYNYSSPMISYQNVRSENYEFVAGINKKINKNFSVQVLTLNPWSHTYFFNKSQTTTSTSFQDTRQWVEYSHIFNIRLSYSFNYGKEGKKEERQRDSEEDGGKKGLL
jgi:hypothetical protein